MLTFRGGFTQTDFEEPVLNMIMVTPRFTLFLLITVSLSQSFNFPGPHVPRVSFRQPGECTLNRRIVSSL